MHRLAGSVVLSWLLGSSLACTGEVGDPTGETDVRFQTENALLPNNLAPNLLSHNALAPNMLSHNALAVRALDPDAYLAITRMDEAGDASRQFMRYLIGCAFSPGQTFSFTRDDGATETYVGVLGLAPDWETAPVTAPTTQYLSACLAARVNWVGVSVVISIRTADGRLTADPGYDYLEGFFFGDLFEYPYRAYAWPATSFDSGEWSINHQRVCTHQDCGPALQVRGSCTVQNDLATSCQVYDPATYTTMSFEPITVGLRGSPTCWSDNGFYFDAIDPSYGPCVYRAPGTFYSEPRCCSGWARCNYRTFAICDTP